MKDKLVFDVTDANTILDSDSVGAFVRSSKGDLVTGTRVIKQAAARDSFAVDNASNTINLNTEKLFTGDPVQLSTTGTLPTGLDNVSTYYVIVLDPLTIQLAASEDDALAGTPVVTFSDDGTGNITVTPQPKESKSLDVNIVDGINVEVDLSAQDDSVQAYTYDGNGNGIGSTSGSLDVHIRDAAGDALQIASDGSLAFGNLSGVADFNAGATTAQTLRVTVASDSADPALAQGTARSLADTLAAAATAESVTGATAALTGRKYLFIRNNDNRVMYIGGTDVDKDNGFPVSPGSVLELRAGDSIDIYYDSEKSGHAIRTLELS